jgi:hypothetical protein
MKLQGRDTYALSTGRLIHANRGILGLRPGPVEPWETRITEGYDGDIEPGARVQADNDEQWLTENPEQRILTAEERKEIAEYMSEQWMKWGQEATR